jgi:NAD+ synthase (glutamine-hydrolysing)
MKIALAQQNYLVGDFKGNLQKIFTAIDFAKNSGADLILFPELAVCGYPPRDFLDYPHFTHQSLKSIDTIVEYSKESSLTIVVGSPSFSPTKAGKSLLNTAFVIQGGKIIHTTHKALLPTYDIFDEYRYFEPATTFLPFDLNGKKIGITICEDIWDNGVENPLYKVNPVAELAKHDIDILLNLSASPFSQGHIANRIQVVKQSAIATKASVYYCNTVGANTDIIFDGGSLVCSPNGLIFDEMTYFEEKVALYDTDVVVANKIENINSKPEISLIHDALILGIKDFFAKLGFKKAIVGLSGGIDSALVVYLAVKALGKENVLSVLMPSQYSSGGSIDDSLALLQNLDNPPHKIIPIKEVTNAFDSVLQPHFESLPPNIAEENIQARIRAIYLMALSNKFGYILLNTTNKSEAAVGYGTLYGDMCGAIGVLGDIYKTQIYKLCDYINKNKEVIPKSILTKAPSAELRPNQKDSDSLPDYDILDSILFEYIENEKSIDDIIAKGYEENLVRSILKMVNRNEFKRYQTPPFLRISNKAFGMGRRLPIVGKYLD